MRTIEHDGSRYLLVKRAAESSLVRDPETGRQFHLPNEDIEPAEMSPLVAAASAVSVPDDGPLATVRSPRALGVLLELDARGPLSVYELLGSYELCESDLHGLFGELRAAGLVAPADVDGRRGYALTQTASDAIGDVGVQNADG
ncbi:MAG: hypothetical protein PPP58_02595 [Natronomonas sp.]